MLHTKFFCTMQQEVLITLLLGSFELHDTFSCKEGKIQNTKVTTLDNCLFLSKNCSFNSKVEFNQFLFVRCIIFLYFTQTTFTRISIKFHYL